MTETTTPEPECPTCLHLVSLHPVSPHEGVCEGATGPAECDCCWTRAEARREAQAKSVPDSAPACDGRPHCPRCDSPDPKKHPAVQFEGEVHICPDPFHAPDKLGDDASNDSVLALIEGILSSPILTSDAARLYGVGMALESRRPLTPGEIAHARSLATSAPEVREVKPAEVRDGDTITVTGVVKEGAWETGALLITDPSFGEVFIYETTFTVSRPVSPLPDQPGVFGTARKAHSRDQSRFNLMTMQRDGELYFVAAHGSEHRAHEIADFLPAGAGVDEGGKP